MNQNTALCHDSHRVARGHVLLVTCYITNTPITAQWRVQSTVYYYKDHCTMQLLRQLQTLFSSVLIIRYFATINARFVYYEIKPPGMAVYFLLYRNQVLYGHIVVITVNECYET
jgi:hypothetical protein